MLYDAINWDQFAVFACENKAYCEQITTKRGTQHKYHQLCNQDILRFYTHRGKVM